MPTSTKSRRRQLRHTVSRERTAWVEFEHNGLGKRSPLINVSRSGISFSMGSGEIPPGLEPGANVPGTVLRVGDCMIYGDMLIMHVTPDADSTNVCGALFYPKNDSELVKLKSVIAGMEIAVTE